MIDWEDKLDQFLDSYQDYQDMIHREDWINWTQEAEDKARDKYFQIRLELLEQLNRKEGSNGGK